MYKTIHTNYGLSSIAAAEAGGTSINLTHMSIGDGGGIAVDPTPSQTRLVNELYRTTINRLYKSPDNQAKFIAEMIIPANIGGFTLREVALFDNNGAMSCVGNLPAIYKPTGAEIAFVDVVIRMEFMVSNPDTITLMIDPNVAIATHAWIINNITTAKILPGGTTGQIARKASNADGDIEWGDPSAATNITVDTIEEVQTLVSGQTVVNLLETTTRGLAIYIARDRLPNTAWTAHPTINTRLTLASSYPDGTELIAVQNEPTGDAPAPLERSRNFADLENAATARTNIGVYSKAEVDNRSPIGLLGHWPSTTPPTGWMVRDGAAISRTTYAALFAVLGTLYGAGDGFTTFNLPDDRGGYDGNADMGRGLDTAMALGAWLTSQNKSHAHAYKDRYYIEASRAVSGATSKQKTPAGFNGLYGSNSTDKDNDTWLYVDDNTALSGGTHARPNGRAYLPIIRAY